MKIKHLIIVSLILAILTIGAVSASDDTDDITAMGDAEDTVVASVETDEVISDGGDGSDVLEDAKEIDMKVTDYPKTAKYNEYPISCNVNITNDDANGELQIYVDDESPSTYYVSGSFYEECTFYPASLDFGTHILHVKYTGDVNYADKLLNFTFTVEDYDLGVDDSYDDAVLGKDYNLYIDIPYEAQGKVIVTYKGVDYTYTNDYPSYTVYVTIPSKELEYGVNNVTIHFIPEKGNKFGEKTVNSSFKCVAEITGPQSWESYAFGEVGEIALVLPSNATGNLSVKINGKDYKNVTLDNGKASISLNDLICGYNYEFEASYVGDDYTVYDFYVYYVDINPKVEIPKYVYSGNENYTIVITLPETTSGNLSVYENGGGEIYSNTSAEGVINILIPNKKSNIIVRYKCGEYEIDMPFTVEVRDFNPKFEINVTDFDEKVVKGEYFSLYVDVPEEIEGEIDGKFTLFVDDVKMEEYSASYIYRLDFNTKKLSLGNHTWRVEFSGSDYFTAEAKSGTFEVVYMDIELPRLINYTYDHPGRFVYISAIDNLTGMATLFIDGIEYDSDFVKDGMGYIYITDIAAGKHDLEVKYEGNYPSVSKKGQVTVDYVFKVLSREDEYAFGEAIELYGYLPEFMTGNISVSVGGKNYYAKNEDGFYYATVTDLAEGEYTAVVTYLGDSKYPSKSFNVTFKVEGFAIILPDFEDDEMYLGEDKVVTLTLPVNATGTLFVKINDKEYKNATLVNGKASISLKDLEPGIYSLEASYNGTDYHVENKAKDEFSVVVFMDYTEYVELNGKAWIYIELPSDAKGNITIDMGEFGKQNLTPINGIINFTLPSGKLGDYLFTLNYTGNDYPGIKFINYDYNICEWVLSEYEVSVTPVNFACPDDEGSNDNKITFTLPEDAKGKLSIYEYDYNYGDYVLVAQVNVTGPNVSVALDMLKPGSHDLKLVYEDEKYGNFTKYMSDTPVSKPTPSISISDSGNDKAEVLTFELPKTATGGLIVKIDGKSYYVPIKDGLATLTVNNLASGNYNVSVTYSGDGNYSYTGFSKIITVASSIPAKIVAKDLAVQYTAGSKYTVTVYAEGGSLAANVDVVIKINGKKVATVKTNAKGIATYKIVQVPGSYKITAEALGKTVTNKLTVKHIVTLKTVKVKKSAKKLVLTATVKVGKKAISKKKVTFKFNGKKYTAKTNKKGVAKVTIKSKVLKKLKVGKKVKYQATYLKDTVVKTVKVKK